MRTRLRWIAVLVVITAALVPAAVSTGNGIIRVKVTVDDDGFRNAVNVASLESEQNVSPPTAGRVLYRALGSNDNTITATLNNDLSSTFTDPGVLIVASQLVGVNCTSGYGSAKCTYVRWLGIDGGEGNDTIVSYQGISVGGPGDDTITMRLDPRSDEFGGIVHCDEGYDRAFVSPFVDTDGCEEVTVI